MKEFHFYVKPPSLFARLIDFKQFMQHGMKVMMLLFFVFGFVQMQAQTIVVSGGTTATASSPFLTLTDAINAINSGGAFTAPVTVDVPAGYTETLTGAIILNATGTSANTLTIQKSGAGANPKLTSYTGTVGSGTTRDIMFALNGSDYVTIDGIDLAENVANTTETTQMEVGYGLYKVDGTNGCQNNTIKNCNIAMSNASLTLGNVAINAANSTITSVGTLLVVTAASGANSNNTFHNNTITGGLTGINSTGYLLDLTNALCDLNNTYTNNSITNYGNSTTGSATGISMSGAVNFTCSNNTIASASVIKHAGTINGIFNANASVGGNGLIENNTITVHGGGTNQNIQAIRVQAGIASATITINNNLVTGCTYSTLTTSSTNVGGFNGILTTGIANYVITNNTLTNNNIGTGSVTTSGFSVLIMHQGGLASSVTITGNTLTGNTYGSATSTATGNFKGIDVGYGTGLAIPSIIITGNNINGLSRNGSTGGSSWGIHALGTAATTTLTVSNNVIDNISVNGTVGTGGTVYGIQVGTSTNLIVDNNTISNLLNNKTTATGTFYGIYNVASPTGEKYRGNTIYNILCLGTNAIYGINSNSTAGLKEISRNTIYNLKGTGAGVLNGIISSASTPSIFSNKVYDLGKNGTGTATTSVVGIYLSTVSSGTAQIYNNMVSDIKANAASTNVASAVGIHLGAPSNTRFNTVYLNNSAATTLAANAGSCGIAIASTGIIQNNIVNNQYSSSGTGVSAAIRRTVAGTNGTAITTTIFGNNIYYQNPGTNNFVYAEGTTFASITNSYFISGVIAATGKILDASFNTNCGLYKLFMSDNGSFSENNLTLSGSNYVPSGASYAESAANTTTTPLITDDLLGVNRPTTPLIPDIGALEFSGTATDATAPIISFTNIPNTICVTDPNLTATITDVSNVNVTAGTMPRIWFKKSTENNANNGNTSADNGWKYAEALNTTSPFQFSIPLGLLNSVPVAGDVIQYFIVAQDASAANNVAVNLAAFPAGFCPLTVALDPAAYPVSGSLKSFTILPDPVTINTVASNTNLCVTGNTVLSLSGDASTGAFYQWQSSPTGANTWTSIAGATNNTYAASGVTSSTDFRCEISCGDLVANGGSPITINNSTLVTVIVSSPTITGTTPGSRCGTGTVTLGAVAAGTGVVNWYAAASGGTSLASGNSYVTPTISASTTYYVASIEGGSVQSVGPTSPSIGTAASSTIAIGTQQLFFNVLSATTLVSVDVFPTAAIGSSFTIQIQNSASVPVFTSSPILTTVTGGTTPQTVILNASLPVGTGYRFGFTVNPGMIRNSTGAVYPYTNSSVSITGNSFSTVYYYYFYNWVTTTGCESARTPVLATVSAPDPLTIAGSGTVECNGAYAPLSISSLPLSNYDSYIWTPNTDLYLDNVGTPYTGGNATTVYVKSTTAGTTTYTVNATNSITSCANVANGSTTFLPGSSLAITGNTDLCISGTRTLSLTPSAGITNGSVQWYMNGNAIGGANSSTYATGTLTTTSNYYAELIDGNANVCLTSPTAAVLVNNPVVTGTTPGSRCGTGTVNLSATATGVNGAPSYNWYATASGGAPLYSGPLNTFTTPVISATTDFYVAATEGGGGSINVGKVSPSAGFSQNTGTAAYLRFTALSNFTLNTVKVYPYGAVDNVPGTMTISIANSAGVIQQSTVVNVIGRSVANATPQVVNVNFNITPGVDQRILFTAYTGGVSGAMRDLNTASPAPVFPYEIPGVVSITNSSIAGYYYYFYDWNISNGCESARQAVTATVTTAPSITASASSTSTCIGNSIDLSVTSSNPDYSYTWSSVPTGYSATGAGPNTTVINTNSIVYNVTAVDNTAGAYAGCGAVSSVTVTAVSNPLTVTASATPSTICAGASSQLNTTATIPAVGYTMNSSCTTPFIDISATGTSVGTVGDDTEHNISFPSFTFNGVPYTTARVGANGVIVFGSTTGEVTLTNAALPSTTNTAGNNFLAPYWDDLDINMGGTIKTEQVGNIYIIQYTGMDHNLFTTGQITFQVQLDLTTGVISYVYPDVVFGSATYDNGLTATVGLQMSSTSAIQYSFNAASLTNGQSICFTPNPGIPIVTYNWSANPTLSATNIGNPMSNGAIANETYTVTVTDVNGCTKSASTTLIVTPCNMTLNLNLWLEGYFDGASAMGEVMLNQNYLPTPAAGDVDDITVELREYNTTTTEYDVIPNGSTVARLHTDGTASAVFSPAPANGSYYVVINHRNHLQTYSHDPVVIGSGTNSYNFKTAATQAAGSNMVLLANSQYGLFSGDINQDGYVDSFDYGDYDLDVQNNVSGTYVATDLNGDGYVDSFDYGLMDTNTQNNVTVQFP